MDAWHSLWTDLEEHYSSSWRNTAAEKRFSCRKRIIDRISAVAQQEDVSQEQAVCMIEAKRTHENLTLNPFVNTRVRAS
jgi:hypothetical protein